MSQYREIALQYLEEPLTELRVMLGRVPRQFDPRDLIERVISALRQFGLDARLAQDGRIVLDYVVEFACPNPEHRSADRNRRPVVRVRWEDDGWFTFIGPPLDGEPNVICGHCFQEVIEAFLLECPRCEVGEESDDHQMGHPLGWYNGSRTPVDYIHVAIWDLAIVAKAQWTLAHPDDAVDEWLVENEAFLWPGSAELFGREVEFEYDDDDEPVRDDVRRYLLESAAKDIPKATAKKASTRRPGSRWSSSQAKLEAPKKPDMTIPEVVAYLDAVPVPKEASVRQAVELVRNRPDCPPISLVKTAQAIRSGRSRVSS